MKERFRLKAREVATAKCKDGKVTYIWDGGSLGLRLAPTGSRSWILRKRLGDKVNEYGLGSYPTVSLAGARTKAAARRIELSLTGPARPTFGKLAALIIDRKAPGMATQTVQDWRTTLGRLTTLNKTPVDKIDVPAIRAALPIEQWQQYPVQTKHTLA